MGFGVSPRGDLGLGVWPRGVSPRRPRNTSPSSGIALVITLILLAIITFLAITLLVVTRSEKGTVGVKADQTTAAYAADAALEQVKLDLLAPMLAFTNPYNFDLLVSTNYINPLGFFASLPANSNPYTNVNYERTSAGAALTPAQMLQNLENLSYRPRPPVFMTNRLAGPTGANELRYFRDENRNGQFDATGLLPVRVGLNGDYIDRNGNTFPPTGPPPFGAVSNYFVGDPQWIGVLEKPGFPHSPTNRFVSRYAFEAIPLSKTLDLNYIYNYSKGLSPNMAQGGDSFFRNMGVGTWEINLAAFLTDLNTNFWPPPQPTAVSPYNYSYNGANSYLLANSGTAFEDALSLLAYRYSTPPSALRWATSPHLFSVSTLFGQRGVIAFTHDFADGYTHGPPMTGTSMPFDPDPPRLTFGWSGSDNPNHFFSTQDFFDRAKTTVNYPAGTPLTVPSFRERLLAATSRTNSSYDRYTFTRLISQIGLDSAPETGNSWRGSDFPPESGKLDLNYMNVDSNGNVVPNSATNSATSFVSWNAVHFFTNASVRLLANAGYSVGIKTKARPFSSTNLLVSDGVNTTLSIQVWPTNFYTPSVHRLLQVAANLYDATTNRTDTTYPHLPSVFRPTFFYDNKQKCAFITGYQEVTNLNVLSAKIHDLADPNDRNFGVNDMVYGVPLIIGVKKGFPNFNELGMETRVSVTRKLEFRRAAGSQTGPVEQTNQMYVVGISNVFGVEAWNSYLTNFPRDLTMYVGVDMTAIMTNELGTMLVTNMYLTNLPTPLNIAKDTWKGFSNPVSPQSSFRVPFDPATNHFLSLANSTYSHKLGRFVALTGIFEEKQDPTFRIPHWWLNLRTRLRFVLVDTSVNRIVDYVNLTSAEAPVDLTYALMRGGECGVSFNPQSPIANGSFWCTNRASASENTPSYGIRSQIAVSEGLFEPQVWNTATEILPRNLDRTGAQEYFYYNLEGKRRSTTTYTLTNTFYSPFNPTRDVYVITSWQANDPLVHYTIGDLTDFSNLDTNRIKLDYYSPSAVSNFRFVNKRYEPWTITTTSDSSSATRTDLRVKDPLITRSDDWEFPTNKFPNIGWLGRVHRGTPWQTVYLKSAGIDVTNWAKWTGNGQAVTNFGQINTNIVNLPVTGRYPATNWTYDILFTFPTNDWGILDVFTTAFYDNNRRGRLGINQTNLAAWSAIFSGVLALQANTNAVAGRGGTNFAPLVIQPVGLTNGNASQLWQLVTAINDVRRTNFAGSFRKMGDILAVPEFSDKSPFMNLTNVNTAKQLWSVNDAVCERLPQQTLGLLALDPPRFLVFAYGQALKPAPRSIVTSGQFFNLCTNYQVTAEAATRTVFRIDGLDDKPPNPRIVIEKFSALPPD